MLYERSCSTKGTAHASFILSISTNTAEVIVNTDCVTRTFIIDKESHIRAKAKSLKKDALKKNQELEDLNCPPILKKGREA